MTIDRDDARSWGFSVAAHALLLLIALFIYWDSAVKIPPDIEILLIERERQPPVIEQAIQRPAQARAPSPARRPANVTAPRTTTRAATTRATSPPATSAGAQRQPARPAQTQAAEERRDSPGSGAPAAVTPPPRTRTMDPVELPDRGGVKSGISHGETPSTPPAASASRERTLPGTDGRSTGESGRAQPPSPSPAGELSGTPGATVQISWGGGAGRTRIAGRLPAYPSNEQREAAVTARFVVAPDGTVSNIVIVQKAAPAFEQAVLSALRTWRFNPLKTGDEQANQTATAVFSFRLR